MAKKSDKVLSSLEYAKKHAMSALDRRALSEKELRDKLREKNCEEEDINTVIALCLDYGFINDQEYACMLARRSAGKHYGPGRLKQEFRQRGIREEYWEEALAFLNNTDDELDQLISQRLRNKDLNDQKEREKLAAALFRKGYSWNDIRAAMNRLNS